MSDNKRSPILICAIILIAGILRSYNLMHDSPYFFDPDERNMASAITQLQLPSRLSMIPSCLLSQLSIINYQLSIPNCNLNPHFFAYGQFPLYLSFISDQVIKQFNNEYLSSSFPSAIFWLRFWSALSSSLTVLLVYLIARDLLSKFQSKFLIHNSLPSRQAGKFITLSALFAAFTPGLIQSAHFGTTESLLTFFFIASVYLSLRYLSHLNSAKFIILNSLILGLSLGTKLTGLFFFVPTFLSIFIHFIVFLKKSKHYKLSPIIVALLHCCIAAFLLIGSISIYFLSSPYNFIDFNDFKSSVFGYETDVATGKYEAFYTRQFVNTTPILFQAEKIFPYTLGWPIFILGTLGLIRILISLILKAGGASEGSRVALHRRESERLGGYGQDYTLLASDLEGNLGIRERQDPQMIIIILSFLIYLIPNSFLFTKWTRFMTPVLPFFSIFEAYLLLQIFTWLKNKHKNIQNYLIFVIWILIILSILPGLMFMSIYTHPDTRVQASEWIYKNIPNNSYILSETANVVDIPLILTTGDAGARTPWPGSPLPACRQAGGWPGCRTAEPVNYNKDFAVISFDFYHLDENPFLFRELLNHLEKAGYILVPSRRIFANYMRLSDRYPLITKYYQLLYSGRLGFDKVTEISSFPQLSIIPASPAVRNYQLSIPDEQAEETWTVFDHPVIRIYKKVKPLLQSDYETLFK